VLGKELLELLGMPVMRAKWEAEALCAELDREGWVDACVTPDSDAFLHGAKCIIKYLQLDPRVSFFSLHSLIRKLLFLNKSCKSKALFDCGFLREVLICTMVLLVNSVTRIR